MQNVKIKMKNDNLKYEILLDSGFALTFSIFHFNF